MNDVKMENGSQNMKIPWRLHLNMEKFFIPINPYCQTEDNTCGLCCLRMVMNYHGKDVPLDDLLTLMPPRADIGLYDSHVGLLAMLMGFSSTIFTYNYQIFHPLWNHLTHNEIIQNLELKKLEAEAAPYLLAIESYIEYLKAGGELLFCPLSKEMILAQFDMGLPLLAALDMGFLYDCAHFQDLYSNSRSTHFVVLHGYDPERNTFHVTDPWYNIPIPNVNGQYTISADRVINAIFLAQDKHDAALVVIQKK
ncbi:MAG TPA: cysteine peptidase family C39 domain-containing protein [Candidatus Sumerlaeota bacterium]|nr:cysteine peptidase family C39 domain-containing protein [Candidatus Sumerlaeota bacterium]HRR29777.1 cysteine peptidase family C39 domain-containing protein [Candidatus Sumerlaeia bacterium]HON50214.1 cysteine peptidase family C39 domain-containing protein [Candidatus Sumerlaeota bacterium]HOR63430.1 cysteine peptidase family C39 domain-containing protein [Candidatus Sumerlaeota bacterium]HPL74181.1 cysteine peptidase family C39 domain-containing protein [Candidatus Sumerlaeota bacterium]